jgi:hypothetical protein
MQNQRRSGAINQLLAGNRIAPPAKNQKNGAKIMSVNPYQTDVVHDVLKTLETAQAGMTLTELNQVCTSYRRLYRTERKTVLADLVNNYEADEYKLPTGNRKPTAVFCLRKFGELSEFKGVPITRAKRRTHPKLDTQAIAPEPCEKAPDAIPELRLLTAAELRKKAEELIRAAEVVEARERELAHENEWVDGCRAVIDPADFNEHTARRIYGLIAGGKIEAPKHRFVLSN